MEITTGRNCDNAQAHLQCHRLKKKKKSASWLMQKPVVSIRQFEDHIEYLKGELARATSQLNAARSDLVASSESLAAAQSEIIQLKGDLVAAKAELADRSNLPSRDTDRSLLAPSMQSMASSFR